MASSTKDKCAHKPQLQATGAGVFSWQSFPLLPFGFFSIGAASYDDDDDRYPPGITWAKLDEFRTMTLNGNLWMPSEHACHGMSW